MAIEKRMEISIYINVCELICGARAPKSSSIRAKVVALEKYSICKNSLGSRKGQEVGRFVFTAGAVERMKGRVPVSVHG